MLCASYVNVLVMRIVLLKKLKLIKRILSLKFMFPSNANKHKICARSETISQFT